MLPGPIHHAPRQPSTAPAISSLGNEAAYVTGWKAGAGLGALWQGMGRSHLPQSARPSEPCSTCGDMGEGSHTPGGISATAWCLPAPPLSNLAQKMAQPPSPRSWRPPSSFSFAQAAQHSLCLSPCPDPQGERHCVCSWPLWEKPVPTSAAPF